MYSKKYYLIVLSYIIIVGISNIISSGFLGIRWYALYSTSMEPSITEGSLILVKKITTEYNIGDVVAYWSKYKNQEVIVAHRIVDYGGNVYVTKGDSNQTNDIQVIIPRLIIGKMIINIPYLGYLYSILNHKITTYFIVFIPAITIIGIEIKKLLETIKEK